MSIYLMVAFAPDKKTILAPASMETFSEAELPIATGRAFLINEMNRHTGSGEPVGLVPLVPPSTMKFGIEEVDDLVAELENHNEALTNYPDGPEGLSYICRAQASLAEEFSPSILAELVRHYVAHQVRG